MRLPRAFKAWADSASLAWTTNWRRGSGSGLKPAAVQSRPRVTLVIGPPPSSLGRTGNISSTTRRVSALGVRMSSAPVSPRVANAAASSGRSTGLSWRTRSRASLVPAKTALWTVAQVGRVTGPLTVPPPQSNWPIALASAPSPRGTMTGKGEVDVLSTSGKIPSRVDFLGPRLEQGREPRRDGLRHLAGLLLVGN